MKDAKVRHNLNPNPCLRDKDLESCVSGKKNMNESLILHYNQKDLP